MATVTTDSLKRSRRPVVREVKKLSEEITTILKKTEVTDEDLTELELAQDLLTLKCNELVVWNQKIAEQMVVENFTEDEENKEFDECRQIHKDYLKVFRNLEAFMKKRQRSPSPTPSEKSNISKSASFKLPKIEIPVFSGEHKDWLGWWATFQRIHEREDLDPAEKFIYLKQALKPNTRAKDLVDRYPASAANYQSAVNALEARFGDTEILIDVYIRDLQLLMIENASSKSTKEKTELVTLYDRIETSLNALDTLGNIEKDHFLYPMVESCLPVPVIRAWQRSPGYEGKQVSGEEPKPKLMRLLEFLATEVKGEERIALATKGYSSKEDSKRDDRRGRDRTSRNTKHRKSEDLPTAMGLVSLDTKDKCLFCDKNHASTACRDAANMPLKERKIKVFKSGKCFNCLKGNHSAKDCTITVLCSTCGGRHHKVMCEGKKAYNTAAPPVTPAATFPAYQAVPANPSAGVPNLSLANFNASPDVLLPTVSVGVLDSKGKIKRVRAAIDTMSGHTYITKRTVEHLEIPPVGTAVFKHAVFGGTTKVVEHYKYHIQLSSINGDFACKVEVFDQELIASGIPSVPTKGVFEELLKRGIILSDHPSQRGQPIDLLIGGDIAGRLWAGPPIQLDCGPTAFQTRFGWTVMGKTTQLEPSQKNVFVEHSLANLHSPEAMWELEAIGITDPATKLSRAEEDAMALEHFEKSVSRNADGRYQVALPWIEGHPPLPTTRAVAQKRLVAATTKLRKQNMYEEYEKIFQEWLEAGIIEEVKDSEICESESVHYLPHRPVIKAESATTKVRPVFDASCKSFVKGQEAPSLNDCLVKGPNLLEQIPNCLLRFREDKVAAIADIRKAFLMIEVKEENRDFLRFLWWKHPDSDELKIFRHRRVVFGVNCSPFLLNAVIEYHLTKATAKEDCEIVDKLRESLYVDNVAASFPDEEYYEIFKRRSTDILQEAKFDLRLWESNIDEEIGPEPSGVLGIKWNRIDDTLFCDSSVGDMDINNITKRKILSANARVFDPLGMLAQVVLVPKRLYQRCCKLKLGWDEAVPPEIEREFVKWLQQMKNIKSANISRYIGVPTQESSIHVFCDASEVGYAAVAYLRRVEADDVSVKFLFCRSRVSPLEKTTINHMELISCEIATRLAKTVVEALGWQHVPVTYWTDSTTARAWILRDRDWGTFVGNRVRKVRAQSTRDQWKHVPGILNPADLPSRGCMLEELVQSSCWKGPQWLEEDPSKWPDAKAFENEKLISKELKKTKTITAVNVPVEEPWEALRKCKVQTWNRMVRVVGWILRFKRNAMKKELVKGPLTFDEKAEAVKKLYYVIQKEADVKEDSFPFKIVKLEDGLYHVKTKLTYTSEEDNFKYPVVLPGKHYLTELLVKKEHLVNNHAGVQFLLANLREKVWIHKARVTVRKIVNQCVRCRRFRATPFDPETAPLPENRTREAAPFEVTGIDFAGPLYPKDGGKVYVALYTCAVYRAVHLELVPNVSTEGFVQSLRCFIARRGRPLVIYTDNGTNFVGAHRQLKKIDWSKIEDEEKSSPIKWIFSAPSAPWWGGWWERLVRSMKDLIFRNIGNRAVYQDELRAVLCDIEATLNGRPLTYVHDNDEFVPLTPAMFMHGPRAHGTPDLDEIDRSYLLRRNKFRHELMDNLRKRFRKEYLGHLVQRRKETKESTLKAGDVVLIGSDNTKRVMWPIGVVVDLKRGRDGVTRVALVKTKNGVLERPVQRLYPMEVTAEDTSITPERVQDTYKTRFEREVKAPQRYM